MMLEVYRMSGNSIPKTIVGIVVVGVFIALALIASTADWIFGDGEI